MLHIATRATAAPCDHLVVRKHVNVADAQQQATTWLRMLPERVASLLDGATYSKNNALCDYDRTKQRCRKRVNGRLRKVDALQPYGHARFSFLEPMPICGSNNSALSAIGHPRSDGHKLVCGLHTLAASKQTVVFSLGSNNNFVFEEQIVNSFGRGVRIHTFDCTVDTPLVPQRIQSNVVFHRVCIGPFDEVVEGKAHYPSKAVNVNRLGASRRVFKTWAPIVKEMRSAGQLKAPPDLFKIDIEGHERSWLWSLLSTPSPWLPRQILMELHYNTMNQHGQWASNTGRRLVSTGELGMLAQLWHNTGYRLISRDDNLEASSCTELNLLLVEGCPAIAQ